MSRRLWAITKARLLEVVRDRTALLWNVVFAPLLVIGMAMMFTGSPQAVAKVGVLALSPLESLSDPFLRTPAVQFYRETEADKAIPKVAHQRIDMLLDLRAARPAYWVNRESPKGRLLVQLLHTTDPNAAARTVAGTEIRSADWLVPGLLSLNIMFTSLLAIGHVIVRYRKSGYLRRLNGTPLRAGEFIGAQLLACLILNVGVNVAIYGACHALLHLRMEGSYLLLLLVTVVGSMSMTAMSLLIAARVTSEEFSGGLLNLVAWPMLLLSGALFSLDGAPAEIQTVSGIFPLTHMLTAARAVILDGAGLQDVARPLSMLCAMTVLFLAVGTGMFRWRQD